MARLPENFSVVSVGVRSVGHLAILRGPAGPQGPAGDVHGSRKITAGTGLTGGGDFTADRTLSADPEYIRDTASDMLVAGTGVTLTKDDPGNTVTISASGGASGGLLGYTSYNPTAITTYTSSGSSADVDATNLTITFTAPASGIVLIALEAVASMTSSSASGEGMWSLRTGTTNVVGSARSVLKGTAATASRQRIRTSIRLTGLVAGTSYTYKWAYRAQDGFSVNTQIVCGTPSGPEFSGTGTAVGPAIMEAWAA